MAESRFKCNGVSYHECNRGLKAIDKEQTDTIYKVIDTERVKYQAANENREGRHGELMFSSRFYNNETILYRILSQTTVADALQYPVEWAWAAFEDCARADHWYRWEKEWD